jgi:hypothetical protein
LSDKKRVQHILFWLVALMLLPDLLRFLRWLLVAAFKLFLYFVVVGLLLNLVL